MKMPGGLDFDEIMKQAQKMQDDLQREMQQIRVQASAGGGAIQVVMNGSKELVELTIDPDTVKSGDVEMLQDLIIAAINEATRKADEAMRGKVGSKLGGLGGLPGGLL
ncbi:MAG TPA: YbaB/EbfC family nucleoid-associated protein [Blastocatellia bacterium]|nr:YbaB/EbfC family nucleoid-associated protein [Blastocatellia bacterium]